MLLIFHWLVPHRSPTAYVCVCSRHDVKGIRAGLFYVPPTRSQYLAIGLHRALTLLHVADVTVSRYSETLVCQCIFDFGRNTWKHSVCAHVVGVIFFYYEVQLNLFVTVTTSRWRISTIGWFLTLLRSPRSQSGPVTISARSSVMENR